MMPLDHAPDGVVIVLVVVMVLIVRLLRIEIWVSLTGIAWGEGERRV